MRMRDGGRGTGIRRIILVVSGDGAANVILFVAVGVGPDIDAREELEAIEICKARDTARVLRLRRIILFRQPTRRIEHAAHIGVGFVIGEIYLVELAPAPMPGYVSAFPINVIFVFLCIVVPFLVAGLTHTFVFNRLTRTA